MVHKHPRHAALPNGRQRRSYLEAFRLAIDEIAREARAKGQYLSECVVEKAARQRAISILRERI
jgi:hypothetical protein